MIRLHGVPVSNYYNIVKTALLQKNIPFEEVAAAPSQNPDYLSKSSMGKIPCIETEHGFLAETHAILDYLEDTYPTPALLPQKPFDRAKVRELVQSLELYIEDPARRGYGVFFGREVPEATKLAMKPDLEKGIIAIAHLAKCTPWLAGTEFTYADIVGYWVFFAANLSAQINTGMNLLEKIQGGDVWFAHVARLDSVKTAMAGFEAARK